MLPRLPFVADRVHRERAVAKYWDRCELLDSIQVLVRSVSLLKWARSNARSWMEGERLQQIMILAAAEGRLDTLRWLSSEGYRIHSKCLSDLVFAAASGAHQENA